MNLNSVLINETSNNDSGYSKGDIDIYENEKNMDENLKGNGVVPEMKLIEIQN
jgi:hypothetical protein